MERVTLWTATARADKTPKDLAAALGVPWATLRGRLRGETEFLGEEIRVLARTLELSPREVECIFFRPKVKTLHQSTVERRE